MMKFCHYSLPIDHLPFHSNHIICMPIMELAPANFHLGFIDAPTLFTISSTLLSLSKNFLFSGYDPESRVE